MEEVMTLKAEREVIERTLRENVADISKPSQQMQLYYIIMTSSPLHHNDVIRITSLQPGSSCGL